MLFVYHSKILHNHCLQFLLGVKMASRETENNAYAKFWGDKQRALWYVMVFSGVVNYAKRRFGILRRLFMSKGRIGRCKQVKRVKWCLIGLRLIFCCYCCCFFIYTNNIFYNICSKSLKHFRIRSGKFSNSKLPCYAWTLP